jgi:hypothetical protein
MMIVVAIVAIPLTSLVALRRRSEAFARISLAHFGASNRLHPPRRHGPIPLADWHVSLGLKYQAAARRPWLPVAPDPPKPE